MAEHALSFAVIDSLAGAEIAKALTISMLSLTIYDYALTIQKEVSYFWQDPYTLSHTLFFFNRYVPVCIIIHSIISISVAQPTIQFCKTSISASMVLNLVAMGVVQAILIIRVWFLFPGDKRVRFALMFSFTMSLIGSAIFLFLSLHSLEAFHLSEAVRINTPNITGCHAHRPADFWRVYSPSLILHTGLYMMTAHHAITKWGNSHQANVRRKLLRDGGVFYLVVLLTVGFVSVGSFFTQFPRINIPAIFSPVALSIISIATNHIMFSLREITAKIESTMEWAPLRYLPSRGFHIEKVDAFATKHANLLA